MKRRMLFVFIIVGFISLINLGAQTTAAYNFSTDNTGSLVDMSSGTTTLISGANSDITSGITDIGFSFCFMGTPYTKFSVNSSGQMRLGSTIIDNTVGGPSVNCPLIVPISGSNRIISTGKVHYKITGEAPNRTLVVEWKDLRIPNTWYVTTGIGSTIQATLEESNANITFIYGNINTNGETGSSASTYISSSNTTNKVKSINSDMLTASNGSTAGYYYLTVANTAILSSTQDGSRRYYSFRPNNIVAQTPTVVGYSSVTATDMTLNWTDNAWNECSYVIYRSDDLGVTYRYVATVPANSQAYDQTETLLPETGYYWQVYAATEGQLGFAATFVTSTLDQRYKYSVSTGDWNNAGNWSPSGVPTNSDNVTINVGHTIAINADATCYNLTVNGTLGFSGTTNRTLTVLNSVDITSTGTFNCGSSTRENYVYIGGNYPTALGAGNLTVNGNLDFYNSSTAKIRLYFAGKQNSTISGTGTVCDFSQIYLNKGDIPCYSTEAQPILNITRSFTTQGGNTEGFLGHNSGTLKISGTYTMSSPVYSAPYYSIPELGGLWLDNPNFTLTGLSGSSTCSGLLRISSGTMNIGTGSNQYLNSGYRSKYLIEGGSLNIGGYFSISEYCTYQQTGGTVKVNTFGSSVYGASSFGITESSVSFNMSGGTIVVPKPNTGGACYDFRNISQNVTITGGLLQFGNSSSGTAQTFYVAGSLPNTVIDNTTANHNMILSGNTSIYGNLTSAGSGTVQAGIYRLEMAGSNSSYPGNITMPAGTLTVNTAGTSELSFCSSTGSQTLSVQTLTGSVIPQLTINNTYAGGIVNLPSGITVSSGSATSGTLNLLSGVLKAVDLTLGGSSTGGFNMSCGGGTFYYAPNQVFGSGLVNYTYQGSSQISTGQELPATISGTLTINNPAGIILSTPLSAGALVLTSGALTTTDTNLLTITGTSAGSVSRTNGQVSGPLTRVFAASTSTGTYLFPLGKANYTPFELISPVISATGPVSIKAEVFDANCGGTLGTGVYSLNTNRYWQTSLTSGAGNFVSSTLKLYETASMPTTKLITHSSTKTGIYDYLNNSLVSGSTISATVTNMDYFVIGQSAVPMVYESSTVTQDLTTNIVKGAVNAMVIGIKINVSGNVNILDLTQLTVNANGTTSASAIKNARIFYTGNSSTFASVNQYGTTVSNPTLTDFVINGSQVLLDGENYFWLTFDITSSAVPGNRIDAQCTAITLGEQYVPGTTTVYGSKMIILSPIVTLPFADNFETGTGSNWNLVNLAYGNKWCAGNATAHYGLNSLYISNTEGSTFTYFNWAASRAYFFRDIQFPASGTVHLTFYGKNCSNDPNDYLIIGLADTTNTPVQGYDFEDYQVTYTPAIGTDWALYDITFGSQFLSTTKRLYFEWTNNNYSGDAPIALDDIRISLAGAMSYQTSTVFQSGIVKTPLGVSDLPIIGIKVTTDGNQSAPTLTQLDIATGSLMQLSDITSAKIYYTGGSDVFGTATLFGTVTPAKGLHQDSQIRTNRVKRQYYREPLTISGAQVLLEGDNYFWLAYDVSASAVIGHSLDASCSSLTIGGITRTPAVTDPAGNCDISSPMGGIYTIGNSSTDFLNLSEAFAALNSLGINAPVILTLASDYNSSAEDFPLVLNNVTGTGIINTITLKTANNSDVQISGSSSGALMVLNGTNYFILDGSGTDNGNHLLMQNTRTSGVFAALQIVAPTNGITVKNCSFSNGVAALDTYGILAGGAIIGSEGANNDNLTLVNNVITKSGWGIHVTGSSSGLCSNLIISGNTIGSDLATDYIGCGGIRVTQAENSQISCNRIFNIVSGFPGDFDYPTGIAVLEGTVSTSIVRNKIENIAYTGANSNGSCGLYINTGVAASSLLIANNIIHSILGAGAYNFSWGSLNGFVVNGNTGGLKIYYNSVNLSGTYNRPGQILTAAFLLNSAGITNLDIRNNIFANTLRNVGPGDYTSYNYAVYSLTASTNFTQINYNNYYTLPSASQGRFGYLESDKLNLTEWQTATSQDLNSVSGNPLFISSTDLHIVATFSELPAGMNAAVPISEVLNDLDGSLRNADNPDMGAYEYAFTVTGTVNLPGGDYPDLTIAEGAVCTLSGDISVDNLNLSTGTLVFAENTLTLGQSDFRITGNASLNALEVSLDASTPNVFPTGSSIPRTWTTSSSNSGELDITFCYPSGLTVDGEVKVWWKNQGGGANWYLAGIYSPVINGSNKEILISGLSNLNGTSMGSKLWTISNLDQTLPVTLSLFTAVYTESNELNAVQLTWTTESETGNQGFNIYRGTDNVLSGAVKITPEMIINGTVSGTSTTYTAEDAEIEPETTYYYWLENVNIDSSTQFYGPVKVKTENGIAPPEIELSTLLKSNYPNPFNPSTWISYSLSTESHVKIEIYNVKGQLVKTLINGSQNKGSYRLIWNGNDSFGKNVGTGIYFCRMSAGKYHSIRKMMMLK